MEVMATIVSGVVVFVIGQIIVRFFIDPIVSFKEHIGSIQHIIVSNHWAIENLDEDIALGKDIQKHAALLMSKKRAIPLYELLSRAPFLPSEISIEQGHHALMLLGQQLDRTFPEENGPKFGSAILAKLKTIFEIPEVVVTGLDIER